MLDLNEFFRKYDLGRVTITLSDTDGDFKATRVSHKRVIMDSIYGTGNTPEAALADLMAKVNAISGPKMSAPAVAAPLPESDDLDGLLG